MQREMRHETATGIVARPDGAVIDETTTSFGVGGDVDTLIVTVGAPLLAANAGAHELRMAAPRIELKAVMRRRTITPAVPRESVAPLNGRRAPSAAGSRCSWVPLAGSTLQGA